MKNTVLAACGILLVEMFLGCAQTAASWQIGATNQRYRGRVLSNGTADFREYLDLQKAAVPRWYKFIEEHGEPDYIIPCFGQKCKMVWMSENLTALPTALGYLKSKSGIPDDIKTFEEQKEILQLNNKNRAIRKSEEELRKNAERSYIEKIKGVTSDAGRYHVEKLDYNNSTKSGVLTLVVEDTDFIAARIWAKFYIEMMARDKNVAIVTGKDSEEGRYIMKNEKIVDGHKLLIEFETL